MNTQTKGKSFQDMVKEVFNCERECLHSPPGDVELGEVVVGTLDDPIGRSLYSCWRTLIQSLNDYRGSLPDGLSRNDTKKIREIKMSLHQHQSRMECIKHLFWEVVHSNFPETRDPNVTVGIRKGWKVVIFKSEQSPLEDFLRHMTM